jgi:uncharacterized protein (DUF1330 family)
VTLSGIRKRRATLPAGIAARESRESSRFRRTSRTGDCAALDVLTSVLLPRSVSGGGLLRRAGSEKEASVSAYVIANVNVTDPVRYEEYRRLVSPTLEKYGGRFIARGGRVEVLEGSWRPGRLVIVEFPGVEEARAWWNSPEYSEAKAIRQATSDGTLVILEGC